MSRRYLNSMTFVPCQITLNLCSIQRHLAVGPRTGRMTPDFRMTSVSRWPLKEITFKSLNTVVLWLSEGFQGTFNIYSIWCRKTQFSLKAVVWLMLFRKSGWVHRHYPSTSQVYICVTRKFYKRTQITFEWSNQLFVSHHDICMYSSYKCFIQPNYNWLLYKNIIYTYLMSRTDIWKMYNFLKQIIYKAYPISRIIHGTYKT